MKHGRILAYLSRKDDDAKDAIRDYVSQLQQDNPRLEWEDYFYVDLADDARDFVLMDRAAFRHLHLELRHGDHVVLESLSECLSTAHACEIVERITEHGARLHVLDDGLDTGTAEGKRTAATICRLAKIDSAYRSNTTKRGRLDGRKIYRAKLGWKVIGNHKTRRPIADVDERETCKEIVRLKDDEGLTYDEIYFRFLREQRLNAFDKEWSRSRIHQAYHAAKAGFPLEQMAAV